VPPDARIAAAGGEETSMRWSDAARVRGRWIGSGAAVAAALALVLASAGGGAARSGETSVGRASTFTGYAFDACNAPKIESLVAWLESPYRALGIYIGGANRACANTQLSAQWAASAVATGWSLIPIYVGLQAPCVTGRGLAKIAPTIAASQGTAAADDAAGDAAILGLGAGNPIYLDMEGYSINDPFCSQAVQAFVSSWVDELHALGYLAGVYGSAASTIRDLQALAATGSAPDMIWIADWNGLESTFGSPYVLDTLWTNHQRLHQYRGAHHETWGGVTIDVDSSFVDAAVVGSVNAQPLISLPPPELDANLSAAGSVSAVDGSAVVSWPLGAFSQSVVVTLTPSLPQEAVPGFGSGGYGVQLQVAQTVSGQPNDSFAAPLTIHIPPHRGELAPMASSDGTSWHPLQPLFSGALPKGAKAGYTRNANGSVDIATTSGGYFALLPEVSRPPAPSELNGHFAHGQLVLSWPKAMAVSGEAVSYQVTLTNRPLLSIPGQTSAAVSRVHHTAPSVYRVIATDAAGKVSAPSKPLVVLPARRPAHLPKIIPQWAYSLSDWQESGRVGERPKAPRIVPDWYWRWQPWHVAPYHIR
jgi:hypothetical protein